MSWRFAVHGFLLAVCAFLVGCGGGGGKAPPKGGVTPVNTSIQARKELFDIAKKIEDPLSFETLKFDIESFEKGFGLPADDPQRWTWDVMDDRIHRENNYSIQTKQAYDRWRDKKMAEERKR